MAGQLLKAACFVRLNVQHLQLLLGRTPGKIHGPSDRMRVAVFIHQQQDLLAACAGGKDQGKLEALARFQSETVPQTQHRIEDKALAVAQLLHCPHWIGQGPAAADEAPAVGFKLPVFLLRTGIASVLKGQAVGHIQRHLFVAAGAAVGEEHLLLREGFGLNEELVEGRMLAVGVVGRHGEFNIAGEIETAGAVRPVDQGNPPNLRVIFRRDDHLGFGVQPVVVTPEDRPIESKVDRIPFRLPPDRLIGTGPETIRIDLLDVAESSHTITRLIRPPAGEFLPLPLTVAATTVGDHQAIAAVAEEQTMGNSGMGGGKGAFRRRNQLATTFLRSLALACRGQLQCRQGRDPFLQQRLKSPHPGIAVKAAREGVVLEKVGQGQKRHPLVMGHIGLDDHPAFPLALQLPAEIHRLVITVIAEQSQPGQLFEILHRLFRRHVQCQQGGIGSNHQLFLQTTLQAEGRNAEGLVLIGFLKVHIAIGRLGNAPGDTPGTPVGNLDRHRFAGGLIQKGVTVGVLKQEGHQVFEHGPGPAEQHPLPADRTVGATHAEPVFERDITPGNGDETAETRLTGQKVVTGLVKNIGGNIEADGKEFSFPIIEEAHVQVGGEFTNAGEQALRPRQGLPGQPLRRSKGLKKPVEPGDEVGAGRWRLLVHRFEELDRADPALGKGEERRRLRQILTDGKQCFRAERGEFRIALFGKDFDPGEITVAVLQPGRSLLFQLSSPGRSSRGSDNSTDSPLCPPLPAEEIDNAGGGGVPLRQDLVELPPIMVAQSS